MLSKEEFCGIIDALGALTVEEIYSAAKELSLLREDTPLSMPSIKKICEEAEKEKLVVAVSMEEIGESREIIDSNEIEDVEDAELLFYISGPNAFPEVPFELSEVIDILQLDKRDIDLSRVAVRLSRNLHRRIKNLDRKIDSFEKERVHEKDLENIEFRYSDILNQYYDYSFWLEDDMSLIEDEIQKLSERIEVLKSAQGI